MAGQRPVQLALVRARPDAKPRLRVDELSRHAHVPLVPQDTALEERAHKLAEKVYAQTAAEQGGPQGPGAAAPDDAPGQAADDDVIDAEFDAQ